VDATAFQLPWHDALAGAAIFMRAIAFVVAAPILGADAVPAQLKAGLALLLVVLLSPVVPAVPASASLYSIVPLELFVGLALGFVCRLVVDVLAFAGTLVGYPTGLSMASMLDPINQTQISSIALFYQVFGTLIFFAIGGHRQIIAAFAKSYEIVPAGTASFNGPWLPSIVAVTGQVLALGLRLAAPILVAGLLVDVCLMLIVRAVPQMNILVVGAPVRLAAGIAALAFSLHVFAPLLAEVVDTSTRAAGLFLKALRG
jgi:flagellar biosynthetic protein FliR